MDVVNAAKVKRVCSDIPAKVAEFIEEVEQFSETMGGSVTLPPAVLSVILVLQGVKSPLLEEYFEDVSPNEETATGDITE